MSDIILSYAHHVATITLNRVEKRNALDESMLKTLHMAIDKAIDNPAVRVIVLQGNGVDFSAGADLDSMKKMAAATPEENIEDAMVLGRLMHTLHKCPKPTIAAVQGRTFGGGVGLVAACDIAVAQSDASFCFSEVKLGLIPAIISPYIVKAIGARNAQWLFMTATTFDAEKAQALGLVHYCVNQDNASTFSHELAHSIAELAPEAVKACKTLVQHVHNQPITSDLVFETATRIAKKRASPEGQIGLKAFLQKKKPCWN